jgi:hypothetical protein
MAANMPSDPCRRRVTRPDLLLLLVAICQLTFALCADRLHANASPKFVAAPEDRTAKEGQLVHFNLLGVDWSKVVRGHVAPEKVVAEFNIPAEYLTNQKLFGFDPIKQTISSIPIAFSYPSMKGTVKARGAVTRIGALISQGSEDAYRKTVHSFISAEGRIREPSLDVNGLCGYVDHVHPGYAGVGFYVACRETDQSFSIDCFPPLNGRHPCTVTGFVNDQLAAQLFFQH